MDQRIPTTSRQSLDTSPILYHDMKNVYPDQQSHMVQHQLQQHHPLNHSQSPLSIHTNYSTPTSQFKVQMWQGRTFDSGVQSMQHSQAPSLMSIHAGSEMSNMSMLDNAELNDAQQQKFDNITASFGPSQEYGKVKSAVQELLQLIKDEDEQVVKKALSIMQNIARRDAYNKNPQTAVITDTYVIDVLKQVLKERSNSHEIVRGVLITFFHICFWAGGLRLVFEYLQQTDDEVIRLLVHYITNVQCSIHKYALLTLHSILIGDRTGKCIALARQIGTLKHAVNKLEHENCYRILSVVVDLIRILCCKNEELKIEFLSLNGITLLLRILDKFVYENLLYGTTRLLNSLSETDPQELVEKRVPLRLSQLLSHGSSKVVETSLECLRNLSHVCAREPHPEILENLVRLLGISNTKVALYTVQTLYNLSANEANKEFLEQNNVVHYLLMVLKRYPIFFDSNYMGYEGDEKKMRQITEELNENTLSTLRRLCCKHERAHLVRVKVFSSPDLFFDRLRAMRPVILNETLQLLDLLWNVNENLLIFRDFRVQENNLFFDFLSQIMHILKISRSQLAQKNEVVENVRISDLIKCCLSILLSACRDSSILQRISFFLLDDFSNSPDENIIDLLMKPNFIVDDSLRKLSLNLINSLLASPQFVYFLQSRADYRNCLAQYIHCPSREIAMLADRAFRVIRGGPTPAYPGYPDRPYMPFEAQNQAMYQGPGPAPHSSQYHHNHHHSRHNYHQTDSHFTDTRMAPPASPVAELMEGAGEGWPETLATDDPFVNVFCPPHTSSPYSSPNDASDDIVMSSPNQENWHSMISSSSGMPASNPEASGVPPHPFDYNRPNGPAGYPSESLWNSQMPYGHPAAGPANTQAPLQPVYNTGHPNYGPGPQMADVGPGMTVMSGGYPSSSGYFHPTSSGPYGRHDHKM